MLLRFDRLREAGVEAFVSTRHGGVSLTPYASLNLGDHVGDRPEAVTANRGILAEALGLPPRALAFVDQVHGTDVLRVSEPGPRAERACADAMISDRPATCLCILVADCVPVLIFDPITRSIGAAHAGWRGTVADIAGRTVAAMRGAFDARPEHMLAAIGPSIGPDDFEVGPEVMRAFRDAHPRSWRDLVRAGDGDRWFVDLWRANALQLESAGVAAKNIAVSGVSTLRNTRDFYSYRAEEGRTGRFAAGIYIPRALN